MTIKGAFSKRERQIMEVLYRSGSATVGEVREAMDDAPSYSSVRALLAILEDKGHVLHERDGARFVYKPSRPREEAAQSALAHLVETFYGGSVERVVASLVSDSEAKLTPEQLERLSKLIDEAREGDMQT